MTEEEEARLHDEQMLRYLGGDFLTNEQVLSVLKKYHNIPFNEICKSTMKIYHFEPINHGIAYTVLAESETEAMEYIHEYTFRLALENPFGTANNGSHYISGYLEEFIKWRYVPHKLEGYNMSTYEVGNVLITSSEG